MTLPHEIFLSHSSRDRKRAADLTAVLRGHGLNVWYSDTNIQNAKQWHDEIGKALIRCDWFIVLLSIHSIASEWVKMELMYALRKEKYREHILPIVIQKCDYEDLSWTLDSFQLVDCANGKGINYPTVLNTWGIGFKGQ